MKLGLPVSVAGLPAGSFMRRGWAAIALEQAEDWICLDLVARSRSKSPRLIITNQVIAEGSDRASIINDIGAGAPCFQGSLLRTSGVQMDPPG